jgi:hypothetical protein
MRWIPDDPSHHTFVVTDYERARDTAGLAQPSPAASPDEIVAYLIDLSDCHTRCAPLVFPGSSLVEGTPYEGEPDPDVAAELGFDVGDLDRVAVVGIPPEPLQVFTGRITADEVEGAVESDPTWSPVLETFEHEGARYWSWLADGEVAVERRTPVRVFGAALRLAVPQDGVALAATRTATVEAALDAGGGRRDSLADVDELGLLAEAMDGADAYVARFSTQPIEFDVGDAPPEVVAAQTAAFDAEPHLDRYRGLATGLVAGAHEQALVVALVFDDAEQADANAARLERLVSETASLVHDEPWSTLLGDPQITTEGRVVIGRFLLEQSAVWHLLGAEPLLAVA